MHFWIHRGGRFGTLRVCVEERRGEERRGGVGECFCGSCLACVAYRILTRFVPPLPP